MKKAYVFILLFAFTSFSYGQKVPFIIAPSIGLNINKMVSDGDHYGNANFLSVGLKTFTSLTNKTFIQSGVFFE